MKKIIKSRALSFKVGLVLMVLVGLVIACSTQAAPLSPAPSTVPAASAPSAAATATALPEKLLKVSPDNGKVGTAFTVTGEGLTPNKQVEFIWLTEDGNYQTQVSPENVEYHDKVYTDKQLSLGTATTDAQGHVAASFKAPEDYGQVHDLHAAIGGVKVARGGFSIVREVTISPQQGPLGTPITISVTGLGWKPYESTISVRYDNHPMGIITAVTTQGTASVQIRAAGAVGQHFIDINLAARSVPFLNNPQSGTAYIPDQHFVFNVTDDSNMPEAKLDWPDPSRVTPLSAAVPKTAGAVNVSATGTLAKLDPTSGPIQSHPTLQLKGLAANTGVELFWVSARGNRVSPSGWSLTDTSLGKFTTGQDGALSTNITIPDDLGGWHEVKVVKGDQIVAQLPYFVQRSLIGVTPQRVQAGQTFTVHVKGVGWTELDNGVAVTYDNAYIGFACGFNSNGDVTLNLPATGGPGIHLIDLYPMLYQGHGAPPWGYQVPFLTFAQDFPGLALGYNLPAFRLAIQVVP